MMPEWQIEACNRLRIEIVMSAVSDYKRALKKSDRLGTICEEQKRLERWLLCPWGQALSGDNGEYIIEKCHKTYKTGTHKNGKPRMPDDLQKKIYEEYISGTK